MALKEGLSDMDYLRSKVVRKTEMVDEKEEKEENDDEEMVEQDTAEEEEGQGSMQQMDSAYESGDKDNQMLSSSQKKVCSNHWETFLNIISWKLFGFHFLFCSSLAV